MSVGAAYYFIPHDPGQAASALLLPLTILIVLQPVREDAIARVFQRIIGTVIGGVLAVGLLELLPPGVYEVAIALVIMLYATAYTSQNYLLSSIGFTITFIVLPNYAQTADAEILLAAAERAGWTLLGGLIALLGSAALISIKDVSVKRGASD